MHQLRRRRSPAATLRRRPSGMPITRSDGRGCPNYCNFAYSAFACFKMGISESASFQRLRKRRQKLPIISG